MLLDKPVDKFLESRRHCCNWQVRLWAQQRRMEQVFMWWRRWFHAFHIIHVQRTLHRRASCRHATPATQPAPLDPEWLQTRICMFAVQSLWCSYIFLSSSHKSLCQMAKNPSYDPSTIIPVTFKNMSNRFEAKVFVRHVCKPQLTGARMLKALGRRSYPGFLFCLSF